MRLFQRKLVPMIGAGCSAAPPSNLPPASALAQLLIDRGAGRPGDALEDIAEEAFARGGWQEFIQLLPVDEWRSRPTNVIVRVLAELCKEGLISQIVTTNWDLLIESALNQIGQPYAKVVDAASLALEPAGCVTLIKLNGCIDRPSFIKATRTQIEAHGWQDAWAAALFAVLVRQNSILFAGYSGASRAATTTIETIVGAGERHAGDFVVDRATPEEMAAASESGMRFMAAITLAAAYTGDAPDFFAALKNAVHPLLLAEPARLAREMGSSLAAPTSVEPAAVMAPVEEISATLIAAGPDEGQTWLRGVFSSFGDCDHADPYVPVLPNADAVAKCILLLAVLHWAGNLDIPAIDEIRVGADVGGVSSDMPCVIAVGPPEQRQDVAARVAASRFAREESSLPAAAGIGFIFGGFGRAEDVMTPFSVARGGRRSSAARRGGAAIAWVDGDALLAAFRTDADEPAVRDLVLRTVGEAADKAVKGAANGCD